MRIITAAVPRSPPMSTKPIAAAEIGAIGRRTWRQSSRTPCLVERIQATQTIRAILTNSDGWAVNPPIAIQFRLPPETMPIPGTKTSSCRPPPMTRAGHAHFLQNTAGMRDATSISGMPMTANSPCRAKRPKKPCSAMYDSIVEDDSTITRPKMTRNRVTPKRRK